MLLQLQVIVIKDDTVVDLNVDAFDGGPFLKQSWVEHLVDVPPDKTMRANHQEMPTMVIDRDRLLHESLFELEDA